MSSINPLKPTYLFPNGGLFSKGMDKTPKTLGVKDAFIPQDPVRQGGPTKAEREIKKFSETLNDLVISGSREGAIKNIKSLMALQKSLDRAEQTVRRNGYDLSELEAGERRTLSTSLLRQISNLKDQLANVKVEQSVILAELIAEEDEVSSDFSPKDIANAIHTFDEQILGLLDQTLCEFYSAAEISDMRRHADNPLRAAILMNMSSREDAVRQVIQILQASREYLASGRRPQFSGHLTTKDISVEISVSELADRVYEMVDALRVNPSNEPWSQEAFNVVVKSAGDSIDKHLSSILTYQPRSRGPRRSGERGYHQRPDFDSGILNMEMATLDRDLNTLVQKYLLRFSPGQGRIEGTPRAKVVERLREVFSDAKAYLRGQRKSLSYTDWAFTKDGGGQSVRYETIGREIIRSLQELRFAIDGQEYSQAAYAIISGSAERILDAYAQNPERSCEPANPEPTPAPERGRGRRPGWGSVDEQQIKAELETLKRDLNGIVDRTLSNFNSEKQGRIEGTSREKVSQRLQQVFTDAKAYLRGQTGKPEYTDWAWTKEGHGRSVTYTKVSREICDAIDQLKTDVAGGGYPNLLYGLIKAEAEKVLDEYATTLGSPK